MLNLSKVLAFCSKSILSLFLLPAVALLTLLQLEGVIAWPSLFFYFAYAILTLLSIANFIFPLGNPTHLDSNPNLRDDLTHLPNLPLFLEHTDFSIAMAKRHKKVMAVIHFHIDDLSEINQRYGYKKGNQLISDIANRLHELVRDSDTVARLGGNRFGLIFNLIEAEEEVDRALQRLIEGMKAQFKIDDDHIILKIQYGICVYPSDQGNSDELNNFTSLALGRARKIEDKNYCYYNKEMNIDNSKRLDEEYCLRQAIERNEFCLYFQPKVDAATGNIKGMEALIRWQHPTRGIVSPVEFIPMLEDSGMIVEAGEWVIRESCRLNKLWQDQGLDPIRVSVNVSSVQFKRGDFVERLALALKDTGLSPEYLEVELTESCLMEDVTKNIDILHEIKKMGVAISIDDFGTGYSSLSYLKKFPIDTLKIDRSFITNVQDKRGGDNAAIVTAIMALSHSLRLDVVAEGVETAQELAYLHALGCKTIQGFLFSKPLNVDEFTKIQQDSMHMQNVIDKVREELTS